MAKTKQAPFILEVRDEGEWVVCHLVATDDGSKREVSRINTSLAESWPKAYAHWLEAMKLVIRELLEAQGVTVVDVREVKQFDMN